MIGEPITTSKMKFIIYKDRKGQFRWRLVARNKKIIANSGEGFTRRQSVQKSIVRLCDSVYAKVIDTTQKKVNHTGILRGGL